MHLAGVAIIDVIELDWFPCMKFGGYVKDFTFIECCSLEQKNGILRFIGGRFGQSPKDIDTLVTSVCARDAYVIDVLKNPNDQVA